MKRILYSILPFCLFTPMLVQAADGYLVGDISLLAGPDAQYPPITELRAGTEVDIQGCINGWTWCDVIVGDDRGWVAGTYLQEEYNDQPVLVTDYGSRIGIPIVAFSLGLYWEQHYHNRPWYNDRGRWESRHFDSRPPPRPAQIHFVDRGHGGGDHHDNNDHHDSNNHPRGSQQAAPAPQTMPMAPNNARAPRDTAHSPSLLPNSQNGVNPGNPPAGTIQRPPVQKEAMPIRERKSQPKAPVEHAAPHTQAAPPQATHEQAPRTMQHSAPPPKAQPKPKEEAPKSKEKDDKPHDEGH